MGGLSSGASGGGVSSDFLLSKFTLPASPLQFTALTSSAHLSKERASFGALREEFRAMQRDKQQFSREWVIGYLEGPASLTEYAQRGILQDHQHSKRLPNRENSEDKKQESTSSEDGDLPKRGAELSGREAERGERAKGAEEDELDHVVKGLAKFDIRQLKNTHYLDLNKQVKTNAAKSKHPVLEKLRNTEDFSGSMITQPESSSYLIKSSTMRGGFLVSTPIYSLISPEIDFGDTTLAIFKGDSSKSSLFIEELKDVYRVLNPGLRDSPIDAEEYALRISGLIDNNLPLVKTDKQNPMSDLIDYFAIMDPLVKHKQSGVDEIEGKENTRTISFPDGKVRYFEQPERHLKKKVAQVVAAFTAKYERKLTKKDFENKLEALYLFRKKMLSGTNPNMYNKDNYINEIASILDIILHLNRGLDLPEQNDNFDIKISFLINNLKVFKDTFIGGLYVPSIIKMLLKEILMIKREGINEEMPKFDSSKSESDNDLNENRSKSITSRT